MTWEYVTSAESDDKPGKTYAIDRREDGAMRCACERFRFTKGQIGTPGKTCKHLLAYQAAGGQEVFVQRLTQPSAPTRGTKVVGETFTFRRAITFGSMTGGR